LNNLQAKLQLAFQDGREAFEFFDLNGSESVKIEEFIFGVEFFLQGNRLAECTALF